MSVEYNPFDPDTIEDPYPKLAELRAEGAVHHIEMFDMWMVSRFEDVSAAMRDPARFSSEQGMGELFAQALGGDLTMARSEGRNIIASDPPVHTRLRRTVNRAFTPQVVRSWESTVQQIAAGLVDDVVVKAKAGDPVDFYDDVCSKLPVTVIALILGIEDDRHDDFKRWANDLLTGLSLFADPALVREASTSVNAYLDQVVTERQANPGDDIISMLVNNGADGEDPLSFDELVGFATVLLVGGTETTTNLLGNWLVAMINQPEVLERLRADRSKIAACIEETVRVDTVTQMVWRGLTDDTTIGGVTMPRGRNVGLLLGSANRDEAQWGPTADRIDLDRDTTGHLGFGIGNHYCLGNHLARLEMRAVIEQMLDRIDAFELAGPAVRSTNFMLRGFTSVPLSVVPR